MLKNLLLSAEVNMNVKKPIIAGLMSLSALGYCSAQKSVQIMSETGVSGNFNQEQVFSGGLHAILSQGKNCTDVYCGMLADTKKQLTLETQLENEYSWAKNFSSWIRETFHLSKDENNLTSELAPVKINKSIGKFDTFAAPVYVVLNDFKEKENAQCAGLVLNSTYNIDNKSAIKFEAEYCTQPAKNIFETSFGKLKDSMTYVISYIMQF